MRTPEEIQARIYELSVLIPKTHPSGRKKLRLEMYGLQWALGNPKTAQERYIPSEWHNDRLPSKIVKNEMAKQ